MEQRLPPPLVSPGTRRHLGSMFEMTCRTSTQQPVTHWRPASWRCNPDPNPNQDDKILRRASKRDAGSRRVSRDVSSTHVRSVGSHRATTADRGDSRRRVDPTQFRGSAPSPTRRQPDGGVRYSSSVATAPNGFWRQGRLDHAALRARATRSPDRWRRTTRASPRPYARPRSASGRRWRRRLGRR